jgi:molybdopterin/thiamine biosynthesis adenylyltransferase
VNAVITLTLTAAHHAALHAHLFPGDGKEAAAIALCGRRAGADRQRLLVREVHPIPYAACTMRAPDAIRWPVEWLDPLLDRAAAEGLSIVKFHSHPGNYRRFSSVDDQSDAALFPGIHAWVGDGGVHASVVMVEDGTLFGRSVGADGSFKPLVAITRVGDDITLWHARDPVPSHVAMQVGRPTPAFGHRMTAELSQLTIVVVGCSGTGSIVIEQLARLGVGRLILIDPERVEHKNLNRIPNATWQDAENGIMKVDVARRSVEAMGLGTIVETFATNLVNRAAAEAAAGSDVIFGCVDSAEGRDVLNRISAYYLIPYIDVGVRIGALMDGTIDRIDGVVHYLRPDGSSLLSRQAYRMAQVEADALKRRNPELYAERQREKYIDNVQEEAPAVISVNMTMAAMAVNELLARLYQTRNVPNNRFALTRFNLAEMDIEAEAEGVPCPMFARIAGLGDITPMLDLPELSV